MQFPSSRTWDNFAPLEQALKKDRNEIEAIALDWMHQTIVHEIQHRPLLIRDPITKRIVRKLFPEPARFLSYSVLFRHSNAEAIQNKPPTIEGLRKALCEITGLPYQDLLHKSLTCLGKIIETVRIGYSIGFESSPGEYTRITDQRIPFLSMQPSIER